MFWCGQGSSEFREDLISFHSEKRRVKHQNENHEYFGINFWPLSNSKNNYSSSEKRQIENNEIEDFGEDIAEIRKFHVDSKIQLW